MGDFNYFAKNGPLFSYLPGGFLSSCNDLIYIQHFVALV